MAFSLRWVRSRWLATAGLLCAGSAACSFVLDFSQCRDDADCANGQGLELVCENSECVEPTDPTTVTCSTNSDCIERFDEMHVCGPSGRCASLGSEECPKVVMPEGSTVDDVVVLGSIIAVSPPYNGIGVPLENAVQLAVEDFNSTASLGGGRKVAWVACDSRGLTDVATTAADHLQDVGVIGIVGPTFSDATKAIAEDVTVPGGTFLITPTATAASITELDDNGLVWRPIESDVHQGAALVDRIALLTDPQPERVVVLAKNDDYGNELRVQIEPLLLQRLPAGGLITLLYSDPASFDSNEDLLNEYGNRIAVAYAENPDTIVIIGTTEVRELILFYLDAYFSDGGNVEDLPRFIVTHGGVPAMEGVIDAVMDGPAKPTLMSKIEGITPIVQDPDNFTAFNVRYRIRFSDQDAITISSLSYDAAMVVMLAAASVGGGGSIDGNAIAEAMPKLVDKAAGVPISFGGAGLGFISDAVDVLSGDGTVDLKGVSGELDFDVTTGEVRTDLVGVDLVPRENDPNDPQLEARRLYALDPPPANGGTWSDIE